MLFIDKPAALKFKKTLSAIAVILCCMIAMTITASAAANNKTELKASGSEAQLILDFPQAAAEEIASMQISLSVTTNSKSAEIEFIPDSNLAAKITESRYHSDTGILNIYLAGTEALFSESSPLTVGKVKISGNSVSAAVEIVKDSVKFVRGGELIEGENLTTAYGDIVYPDSVTITTKTSRPVTSGGSSHTHSYGDWKVTVDATCLKEGERIRTCRICGREDIETIPQLDHNYLLLGSHEADGTTAGYADYICVYCAETKREFDFIPGDVDRNGRVNSLDAATILKATVNKTDMDLNVADYNKDGTVNALDAAAILKWVVSL